MSETSIAMRSILNPLAPLGVGTPDTESLMSYFCRLALSHCVTTSDLARKVTNATGGKFNPKWNWKSVSLSGISGTAEKWSQALTELTSIDCRNNLTLLPWRKVIAETGLISTCSRWCPACFAEDRATGGTPYTRLAWDIGMVTSCTRHETKLSHVCPACGRRETGHRSAYIVPGWCTKCGAFLGNNAHSDPTPEETWIANQVGGMVARQATLETTPSLETLRNCIQTLVMHLDGGRNAIFAGRIGVNKSTAHYWLRKGGTPTLSALLRIALHAGIDLPKLLTGDLTGWSVSCIETRRCALSLPERKRRKSPLVNRSELLRAHLVALNESKEPISVREAARRLDVHPRQLYQSANDETRTIGERWKNIQRYRAERNREIAREAIQAAYFKIQAEGKCVNLRELRNHVPNAILGSVRDIFALIEEVEERIGPVRP
ncbi:TPA: TniQ family protein [Burkholderia multivorans]|nr:TniQ family protein [Burkholderia multivorans]